MTGPLPQPAGLDLVTEHAAQMYALEQAAELASVGPLRTALARLLRSLTRRWITMFGSTTAAADPLRLISYVSEVRGELRTITPDVAEPLADYAMQARQLGIQQAVDEVLADVDLEDDDVLPEDVQLVLDGLDDQLAGKLTDAERAFERIGGSFDEALGAFAHAQQAATTAERATAWVTNRSANSGVEAVADELGVERIWLAERDACVHCQGLSGETSVDGVFDATKTYGEKPLAVWPGPDLTSPPRHPRCRCRTQPWLGTTDNARGPDLRVALRREAARSIATGWRRPSESERVRLGAAERLLAAGTTLPKSVHARARAAVRRGKFDTFPRITTR